MEGRVVGRLGMEGRVDGRLIDGEDGLLIEGLDVGRLGAGRLTEGRAPPPPPIRPPPPPPNPRPKTGDEIMDRLAARQTNKTNC